MHPYCHLTPSTRARQRQPDEVLQRRSRGVYTSILLLALGLWPAACGLRSAGDTLQLPLQWQGTTDLTGNGQLSFTNPAGWQIVLSTAQLTLGPLYLSAIPQAPDVQRPEAVILAWLGQLQVDALAGTPRAAAFPAQGLSGRAVAMNLGLYPYRGGAPLPALPAAGAVGRVAGRASRGAVSLIFDGPLAPDLNAVTPALPPAAVTQVRGAAVTLDLGLDGGPTSAGQALLLRVDPRPWFDAVDFAALATAPPAPTSSPSTWTASSSLGRALWQGVQARVGAYTLTLTPTKQGQR